MELLLGGLLELERQALPASMPVFPPASFRCVRCQAGHRYRVFLLPGVQEFRLMSGQRHPLGFRFGLHSVFHHLSILLLEMEACNLDLFSIFDAEHHQFR